MLLTPLRWENPEIFDRQDAINQNKIYRKSEISVLSEFLFPFASYSRPQE
jgi:hypothetical protein